MSLILRWFGITNFVVILFVAAVAALGWSVRSALADDTEIVGMVVEPDVIYEDGAAVLTEGVVHMLQKHEAKDLDWFLIWPTLGVFILAITCVLWDMYRRWKRLE